MQPTRQSRKPKRRVKAIQKLQKTDITKLPVWAVSNTDRALHKKVMKEAIKQESKTK